MYAKFNPKFLIQQKWTLLIELTKSHYLFIYLDFTFNDVGFINYDTLSFGNFCWDIKFW